jgi:CheY-like chemotaxis protein
MIEAHQASHSHGHVLVVGDTIVQPDLTARMLRRVGCRVTQASGMLAGLQVLCETQFDLILIDTGVSGVGVAEGLQWLRRGGASKAATTSDTPVIAITGPGLPVDTQRLRELGFDDHVCKPFRQGQMVSLLNQHLRKHAPAEFRQSTGVPLHDPSSGVAPTGPAPVLDPVALARLTELDPTGANRLLARVLQAFQTSVARLRPQADAARASGDQAALRLVAHTLKSSSASIGAMHLSQLCAQIEAMIRGGDVDDLDAKVDTLGVALDEVLMAIEQLLKERA